MTHDQDAQFMRHHRAMRNLLIVIAVAAACFVVLLS